MLKYIKKYETELLLCHVIIDVLIIRGCVFKFSNNQNGFTILELVIVVVSIIILLAVVYYYQTL